MFSLAIRTPTSCVDSVSGSWLPSFRFLLMHALGGSSDGPSTGSLLPVWETWIVFLALGFAQLSWLHLSASQITN